MSPYRCALCVVMTACSAAPAPRAPTDLGAPRDASVDAARADAARVDAARADAGGAGDYRTSLGACWTDVTCKRALLIAHGGAWNLASPAYGSSTAFQDAVTGGADAIKADVRFSMDGVPVVVHSSPFQAWEIDPLDVSCIGKSVENMLASDIVKCRLINGDHIQRLGDLLAWARGKIVVMLCVKVQTTTPQTISFVVSQGATDFAFLEIDVAELAAVQSAPGHDQVYFLIEAASAADVSTLLALHDPRAFMCEDANTDNFGGMTPAQVTTLIDTQLHPAGKRAFEYIKSTTASAQDHQALWNLGFDVVMTNSFTTGLAGRMAINTLRGVSPP